MIKSSALIILVHFFTSARSENICVDQSDQREYRKYLAGLIKKENITDSSIQNFLPDFFEKNFPRILILEGQIFLW